MKQHDNKRGGQVLEGSADAHAKVNLFLRVLGIRPDGYHEIESLVSPVDLHDTVSVRLSPGGGQGVSIAISCRAHHVPEDDRNLAYRAAGLFLLRLSWSGRAEVEVKKRIPVGAGLGGGSSDAGATLRILNDLCGNPFPLPELAAMGATLGADVPFFVYGGPAIIEGIGERVIPVSGLLPRPLVIVHPGVSLSTAAVYAEHTLALTRPEKNHRFRILKEGLEGPARAVDGPGLLEEALENDLEEPAFRICPGIRDALIELYRQGASAVLMTGSGSAVFGFFKDDVSALKAAGEIGSRRPGYFIHAGGLVVD